MNVKVANSKPLSNNNPESKKVKRKWKKKGKVLVDTSTFAASAAVVSGDEYNIWEKKLDSKSDMRSDLACQFLISNLQYMYKPSM